MGGEQRNASTGDMPNAAGNWTEFVSGAIPATVGDLTDVSNTAPTVGQVLKWDGSQWVPSADATGSGGGGGGIEEGDAIAFAIALGS